MEKLLKYGKLIATDNQNFDGIELYALTAARTKKIYFYIQDNNDSEEKDESLKLTIIVSGRNKEESNTEPIRQSFVIKRLKFIDFVLMYITQNIVNFEEFDENKLSIFLNKIDKNLKTIQKRKGNGRGYGLNKNFNLIAR
ncbi:hypothetical protein WAF17_22580 (plasmid) [Bernardetia sp. ABR2-2B]|uniref:hypothetical protein n=1 Tax=Bernardetia sp. ABR2-2B TaxID=3127472 RepID=UPI0030CFF1B1